jgi:hypothetical protein
MSQSNSWHGIQFIYQSCPFQVVWLGNDTSPEMIEHAVKSAIGLPLHAEIVITCAEPFPGSVVILNENLANCTGITFTVHERIPNYPYSSIQIQPQRSNENHAIPVQSHEFKQEKSNPNQSSPRKRTLVACERCQKAKLGCDTSRPCQRCVRSGNAESCVDRWTKRNSYEEYQIFPTDYAHLEQSQSNVYVYNSFEHRNSEAPK